MEEAHLSLCRAYTHVPACHLRCLDTLRALHERFGHHAEAAQCAMLGVGIIVQCRGTPSPWHMDHVQKLQQFCPSLGTRMVRFSREGEKQN